MATLSVSVFALSAFITSGSIAAGPTASLSHRRRP